MEDENWRHYLRKSNGHIFTIIKRLIMVAASDHPQEFQNQRGMIAETLFSCELINCSGCGKCQQQNINVNVTQEDDEATTVSEVLKMKQVIESGSGVESESMLLESLTKLEHMVKSVTVLKSTGIGISVNAFRNHTSKNVAKVSRRLVKEWKCMVHEWMDDTEKMQEEEEEEEEGGNPTNPPEIEKQIVPESNQQRKPMIMRIKYNKEPVDHSVKETIVVPLPKGPVTLEQKVENNNDNDGVLRIKGILERSRVSESVVLECLKKLGNMRLSVKTLEATRIDKSVRVLEKHGSKDVRQIACALLKKWEGTEVECMKKESSVVERKRMNSEKFEATKRKMRESYEEAENKKKKRRVQVVQLHEFTGKGFSIPIR